MGRTYSIHINAILTKLRTHIHTYIHTYVHSVDFNTFSQNVNTYESDSFYAYERASIVTFSVVIFNILSYLFTNRGIFTFDGATVTQNKAVR